MIDLATTYMGLRLRNPLIAGSSSLTGTIKGVKACAAAGAGAVVLKSLFEEQIVAEVDQLSSYTDASGYGEAADYLQGYGMELGPRDYLNLVSEAKGSVDVPIIASLNCISDKRWGSYARKLEQAGADGIELNIALMPTRIDSSSVSVEEAYYRILADVKSKVGIPVALKIGPYFSSLAQVVDRLSHDRVEGKEFSVGWCEEKGKEEERRIVWRKADGLVLFNRFYQLDIDIEKESLVAGNPYSSSTEIHTPLRWISVLAGRTASHLSATTGVHNYSDVVKYLLAGAQTVQLCSVLYQGGLGSIETIREGLTGWMERHGYQSLADFRGKLSQLRSADPEGHERLQYIKVFAGIE